MNVTFTDTYSSLLNWSFLIDNGSYTNLGLSLDFTGNLENVSSGLHYFNVSGEDEAGNTGYADVWFTIGPTPPAPTPSESPLAPLGAFSGLAAIIVGAGWVLFAIRSFFTVKITPQAMVGLLITLVIGATIVAWLIIG